MGKSQAALLAGSILSLAGSVGLIVWGSAIAGSFLQFAEPAYSIEHAYLIEVALAGVSGMAFGAGAAVAAWAFALGARDRKPHGAGLALLAVAGILTTAAGIVVFAGVRDAGRAGETLASSRLRPAPEDVAPAADGARKIAAGYAALFVAQLALLASAFGRPSIAAPAPLARALGYAFAAAAALSGLAVALFLAQAGFDRSEFTVVAASSPRPRPSEVAMCLLGLLDSTRWASVAIALLGVSQTLLAMVHLFRGKTAAAQES